MRCSTFDSNIYKLSHHVQWLYAGRISSSSHELRLSPRSHHHGALRPQRKTNFDDQKQFVLLLWKPTRQLTINPYNRIPTRSCLTSRPIGTHALERITQMYKYRAVLYDYSRGTNRRHVKSLCYNAKRLGNTVRTISTTC